MSYITKKQFLFGSIWKIIEQFSSKGLSLVFSIILARMLDPRDYGLIALTVVFTNFSEILIDGGFSTALIQKKHIDNKDISSVWLISITFSTLLYVLLFNIAPYVSQYYREPELLSVLRVIGLILFIQGFSSLRTAFINRNMQFKLMFRCNLVATLASGIIGVILAYLGYGVWALVIQRLLQQTVLTLLLLFKLHWKITIKFDIGRIRELLGFSVGVVLAAFINYFSSSIYSLIIGKSYSVEDLGYFDKGSQLPTQLSLYTFGAMSTVLLPTLSSSQEDLDRIKRIVRKIYQMTSYLIAPMMVGLALVSQELVIILFTEKWLPIVPIMQANCLYYFATPFMLINIQVFFALGHSFKRVKMELIRFVMLVVGVIVFGLLLKSSLTQLAIVCAVVALLSCIETFFEVRKLISYDFVECFFDIAKPIFCAAIMGGMILFLDFYLNENQIIGSVYISLAYKSFLGFGLYLILSILMKIPAYHEIVDMLQRAIKGYLR